MDISELWAVLQWYNKHLGAKLPKRFAPLHSVLNNNIQPNNAKQAVAEPAKQLTDFLRSVPIDQLTTSQLKFLADIEVGSYIGEQGARKIEDLLSRSPIDPVAASTGVQDIISALTRAMERIARLTAGLEGLVEAPKPDDNYAIVRVTFAHAAALKNVVDLKEWGDIWHSIARGITMAYGMSPEDVRVVGAARGSIIIDLAVCYAIAKVVASIVNQALDATNKLQDIRLKEQQIRELRLKNDAADAALAKASEDLLEAIEKGKEGVVDTISSEVMQHAQINANGDGERANALVKSVRLLVDFLDKGGDLDIVVKTSDKTAAEGGDPNQRARVELEKNAAAIRQLTRQIRAIEHKVPPADEKAKSG